ncbi:calcium-binding protein [Clonorchis sinensis]|uniref:Calcium-binding protein n=1 Tax=Clonorchis sinensis TaxID=79923 RepID=H2KSM4_CLOSI|nr:calcium-binding protein [Clonorchis sinensis]
MAYLKILEQKFETLDRNHDGKITLKELSEFLVAFGFQAGQAQEFMKKFDTNKDGVISKDEFLAAVRRSKPEKFTEAKLRAAFQKADKDKSGKISVKELMEFLKEHDHPVPRTKLEKWLKKHDKNKNGELEYEEFLAFVSEST